MDRSSIPNWKQIENILKGIEFPLRGGSGGGGGGGGGLLGEHWRLVEETTSSGRKILRLEYTGGDEPQTVQVFQA